MCAVSNIGDFYGRTVPERYPWVQPNLPNTVITLPPEITKAEFDALKREVEELKKLLTAAKAFDAATGQPDCEQDEKVALLKRIAELVGVDLDEVLA